MVLYSSYEVYYNLFFYFLLFHRCFTSSTVFTTLIYYYTTMNTNSTMNTSVEPDTINTTINSSCIQFVSQLLIQQSVITVNQLALGSQVKPTQLFIVSQSPLRQLVSQSVIQLYTYSNNNAPRPLSTTVVKCLYPSEMSFICTSTITL